MTHPLLAKVNAQVNFHCLARLQTYKMYLFKCLLLLNIIFNSTAYMCKPCYCYRDLKMMRCSGSAVRSIRQITRQNLYWSDHAEILVLIGTEIYDLKSLITWKSLSSIYLDENSNVKCSDVTYLKGHGLKMKGIDSLCETSTKLLGKTICTYLAYQFIYLILQNNIT